MTVVSLPSPDRAVHLVQAPRVGFLLAYGLGGGGVSAIPGEVVHQAAVVQGQVALAHVLVAVVQVATVREGSGGAGAGGVFELCFGGQTEAAALVGGLEGALELAVRVGKIAGADVAALQVETVGHEVGEVGGFVPADLVHRAALALRVVAVVVAHQVAEGGLGDLGGSHVESVGESDLVG